MATFVIEESVTDQGARIKVVGAGGAGGKRRKHHD